MKCRTKFCRGAVLKHHHSPFCAKCRTRRFKEKFPLKYSFNNLRKRARHRGHAFQLTFEQYEKFAIETGYAQLKGKHKYSLSIHRADGSKGYHIDNITAVTLSTNSRLEFADLPPYLKAELEELQKAEIEKSKAAQNSLLEPADVR